MSRFRRIHWCSLDISPVKELPAPFLCLWPHPVDYDCCFRAAGFTGFADSDADWDQDLDRLVEDLFACLARIGHARLIRGELPVRRTTLGAQQGDLQQMLVCAATDDQFPLCVVGFGAPVRGAAAVSDGHPIFWIGTGNAVSAKDLLDAIAGGRDCVHTTLDWSILLPSGAA